MNTVTIHHLTQQELKESLSEVANKRDKALILLAYSYGLRASTKTAQVPTQLLTAPLPSVNLTV